MHQIIVRLISPYNLCILKELTDILEVKLITFHRIELRILCLSNQSDLKNVQFGSIVKKEVEVWEVLWFSDGHFQK